MNTEKWIWIILGCKVGQNVPIVMKLKLEMSRHLLDIYNEFQIDILRHVYKSPEMRKTNRHNSDSKMFAKNGNFITKCTEGYLYTKFEIFILI